MNPSSVANGPLKHKNPQFYIGNTEVTRRILWPAGALLGTKIHPVGPLITHFNVAKQAFPATKRLTGRSYVLQCLALRFHCTQCTQTHESSVLHKKNGGTVEGPLSGGALLGIKIHLVGPFLTQFNAAKQAFPAT